VIGRRSLEAVRWQLVAGLLRAALLFARFVALARLLPVEVFGIYALAVSVVHVTGTLADFGLAAGFLQRVPETEDEGRAARVLFTLRSSLLALWAAALAAAAWAFAEGPLRTALLALVACALVAEAGFVPRQILTRRLRYGRMALYDVLDAALGTLVALALAGAGAGLWALLATNAAAAALQLAVFVRAAPPWRPGLCLDRGVARYLLRFGSRGFASSAVDRALERLPDLWIGGLQGELALGFYSRARRLVAYPQELATGPLVSVLPASYAALGPRRAALAAAARLSLGALARVGAGLAALLLAAAPVLVEGLLGPRWLAAVAPLRVLSVLVALEPLRLALSGLLAALGRPGAVARQRAIQLALLAAGLLAGAGLGSTAAVAAAVVSAAGIGTWLLGSSLRRELGLPLARVAGLPLAAAAAAAAGAIAGAPAGWAQPAAAGCLYAALLAALDRAELLRLAHGLRGVWSSPPSVLEDPRRG
jgi:PST family polysaccharide transporter